MTSNLALTYTLFMIDAMIGYTVNSYLSSSKETWHPPVSFMIFNVLYLLFYSFVDDYLKQTPGALPLRLLMWFVFMVLISIIMHMVLRRYDQKLLNDAFMITGAIFMGLTALTLVGGVPEMPGWFAIALPVTLFLLCAVRIIARYGFGFKKYGEDAKVEFYRYLSYVTIALYSTYVVYDTQRCSKSSANAITCSTNLYMDAVNILIEILYASGDTGKET